MPYQLDRPYLKDRREPFAGPDADVQTVYVDGRWFDHTTLSDDAYGNRITEPGMVVAFNTVSGKLEPYDHNNGSPAYEAIGINKMFWDIRNGDVAMNPVNGGKIIKERCWALNTGGSLLTGDALVTALAARLAANHFELIKVQWVGN